MHNFKSEFQKNAAVKRGEQGFSLLELMIATMIFLIVTASIYGVLQVAQRSRLTVNQKIQLTKNVRFALNLIGRETYNAGYGYPIPPTNVILPNNRVNALLGVSADSDSTIDKIPPMLAGNNITLNTMNGATGGARTDQVTFLFKDSTFNLVGSTGKEVSTDLAISTITPSSGILQIDSAAGTNALCTVNDLYLITGKTGTNVLGVVTAKSGTDKIQFSNSDLLGFNQTGNTGILSNLITTGTGAVTSGSILRVKLVTYFVTTDGILTRREYANNSLTPATVYVDEPLVYGVEDFQIQYVMSDGSILDNPSAGADGIFGNADDSLTDLGGIRQVKYTISVRSIELDPKAQPYRISMSSTFSTRNFGYDAS